MLQLGLDGRPQSGVPIADLPSECVHSVENREREPEEQHATGASPHQPLNFPRAIPAPALQRLNVAVDLDVRFRRGTKLVVEQHTQTDLRRCVVVHLARLRADVDVVVTIQYPHEWCLGVVVRLCLKRGQLRTQARNL